MKRRIWSAAAALLIVLSLFLNGCGSIDTIEGRVTQEDGGTEESNMEDSNNQKANGDKSSKEAAYTPSGNQEGPEVILELTDIPEYSGEPYVAVNGNVPYFTDEDMTTDSYESYSNLDSLGRCGVCMACVGRDIMPTEERGSIGSVKPTGWHTVKYDCVDGNYLYNRCHLIGFQLTGENANERNLITGTRYMNVNGMLLFEDMVADHVKETDGHVLYRVTPVFEGDNLVASGVLMEAKSVEDDGEAVLFNVFCYNVQPGIGIDYATGESEYTGVFPASGPDYGNAGASGTEGVSGAGNTINTYVLNTNSQKFHYPDCKSVDEMNESNKQVYTGTREELIGRGYTPCKSCNP